MAEYVVGAVGEIPEGGRRIIKAGDVEIGVFHLKGAYYAIPNHCFHQGGPLCEGNLGGTVVATPESGWKPEWTQDDEIIVCPWHGLEFNLVTGRCLARRSARLRRFRVKVEDGLIKIIA